jgi:hypothetical protein
MWNYDREFGAVHAYQCGPVEEDMCHEALAGEDPHLYTDQWSAVDHI